VAKRFSYTPLKAFRLGVDRFVPVLRPRSQYSVVPFASDPGPVRSCTVNEGTGAGELVVVIEHDVHRRTVDVTYDLNDAEQAEMDSYLGAERTVRLDRAESTLALALVRAHARRVRAHDCLEPRALL
jgi:hypothetical protein